MRKFRKAYLNWLLFQLVKEATHIEGGHIDHVYIRSEGLSATVEMYSPYYTAKDHDALCISISESEE